MDEPGCQRAYVEKVFTTWPHVLYKLAGAVDNLKK
jgi:hypothetical protein